MQEFIFMWTFNALVHRMIHVQIDKKRNNVKPRQRKRKPVKTERFKYC